MIIKIIHENIPVYCDKKTSIPTITSVRVPIKISLAISSNIKGSNNKTNLLYYEGNSKQRNIEGINGILDQEYEDKFIKLYS